MIPIEFMFVCLQGFDLWQRRVGREENLLLRNVNVTLLHLKRRLPSALYSCSGKRLEEMSYVGMGNVEVYVIIA